MWLARVCPCRLTLVLFSLLISRPDPPTPPATILSRIFGASPRRSRLVQSIAIAAAAIFVLVGLMGKRLDLAARSFMSSGAGAGGPETDSSTASIHVRLAELERQTQSLKKWCV